MRYTLEGAPLGAEELPAAQRAASRLGSAVERDPLRAGEKGAVAAGYTLGEALDLARSSVPAQRVAGLTLFAKVAAQARRWGGGVLGQKNGSLPVSRRRSVGIVGSYGTTGGPPSDPTSLPPPLPAGVAWQDVWLHALVDKSAVLTLRRALDDAHLPAASAAAKALAAIVCVGGPNELGVAAGAGGSLEASGSLGAGSNKTGDVTASAADTLSQQRAVEASAAAEWYDALECAPPLASPMTAATAPLWRSGGWGATFAPLAWETASGRIELAADGTVMPDPADEATDRIASGDGEEGASSSAAAAQHRRSRATAHAADPTASALRVGLLPRLRYLLEVGRHPASVAPALAMLAGAARHSAEAATAVARCPRLSSTLVDIACEPSETEGGYPPGSQAAATRVLRVVAASGAAHARRLGADGVASRVVAAAFGSGGANAQSSRRIEALRLWATVAAAGGATPSVDGLYPLLVGALEAHGKSAGPLEAATAASVAAETFGLLAALAKTLAKKEMEKFSTREGWRPPEDDRAESSDVHASTAVTMSDALDPLSWSCAAGAAEHAEAWTSKPPAAPRERGYSPAAWRAAGAAAHFLAELVRAACAGGTGTESARAAAGAGRRALGIDAAEASRRVDGVGVLDPSDGLAAAALDALGCGANDGSDADLSGRAAVGVALHGALRLVAATPHAATSAEAVAVAQRAVRQLTIASSVRASSVAGENADDGSVRAGRALLVAAAELPVQRALVAALEILDAAAAAGEDDRVDQTPADDPADETARASAGRRRSADDAEAAVAAAEATAALVRALPPGAGLVARDAVSAGVLSRRALGPLLRVAAGALRSAASRRDEGGGEVRRWGGFAASSAADLDLGEGEQDASALVPSLEEAREALLGGFALELLSDVERAEDPHASETPPPGPLVGAGSIVPLPAITRWLLAPCSPRSSVRGWGPRGAAASLALLLALESSGSLVTRDLPAEAKLSAVSGVFCSGADVWRDPAVAANAAALTDVYWGRLEEEKSSSANNPRMGVSAYGDGDDRFGGASLAELLGGSQNAWLGPDETVASTVAAQLAEDLSARFAHESFGDKLFARHVAFQLRAGSMPRARAAAWIALRDGVAFHVLPPLPALAPRPERGDAALFLPPGGEPDEEMTELYVAALESGALDRCLADAEREGRAPAVPAALALHAVAHAARTARGTTVLRRLTRRVDGEKHPERKRAQRRILLGILRTPLTQRRRPAVARAAAAGARGKGGGGIPPFGPGAPYGETPPAEDERARRAGLLAACEEDDGLKNALRYALGEDEA